MRLIFKEWDSAFNPVVTAVGAGFLAAGVYGMALFRHVLQHPIVLIVAAIPALFAVMGVLVLIREVQLFRGR
jgi:hypothetical protein